ncbi:MAG TPA: hypothetical protein PKN02_11725, partial [Thermotogota bacterium]|nr:hypothetical protein [Thermotogota bacterium]
FNILWSCPESKVIPFYYSIQEEPITRASFAKEFFSTFAGHYLSFLTRNKDWVITPLNYVALKEHVAPYPELQMRCRSIDEFEKTGNWNLMWKVASRAPSEIAASKNFKIVQIIDEFQNINAYVLDERGNTIESLSGTYLDLAEKKEAPLIVSGSEVHGLMRIIQSLTARFKVRTLGNLPEEEAKEAIRRYGYVSQTKINEQAEEKIWNLTQGDPLYIRALMLSEHNEARDYTQESNIVETYTREITHGEIYDTWMEYIAKIFVEVNERNAKRILLYLFQAGEERTRAQIIKDLKLEMTDFELQTKLQKLMKADLISRGETYFDYKIAKDKTYELVFRHLFQKEIDNFVPDIRKELRQEMGRASYEKGKFREYLVRERIKKPFNLKDL